MGEFRHIVRIAATELKGRMSLRVALEKVKGVGPSMAHAIITQLKMDPKKKIGDFSDEDLAKIEKAVRGADKLKLPEWMLNRKNDINTGESTHLVSSDLQMTQKKDVDIMKKIKSYRGMRHAWGLKVRGQRTKSTGRKGKTVGVQRRKVMARMKKKAKEE